MTNDSALGSVPAPDGTLNSNGLIEITDINPHIARCNGEVVWLLLNYEISYAEIVIESEQIAIPIESIKIHGKLVVFVLPILTLPHDHKASDTPLDEQIAFLHAMGQKIQIPLILMSRESSDGTSYDEYHHINSLFNFAQGGDPIVLLKPIIKLLKIHNDDLCNLLHIAAMNKQNFALKTLLRAFRECGHIDDLHSIVNAINARGQTPLHCAVRAGDTDCVHYLLASGASKVIGDCEMNTVAHYLCEVHNEDIYKEILEQSDSSELEEKMLKTGSGMQIKNEQHILAIKNADGYTPLHLAVRKLKFSLLEALIEAGAPLDVRDDSGETPIIAALVRNDVESAALLIQGNCDVNVESNDGDTPLLLACELKNLAIIGHLLDAGADPYYANKEARKPIDIEDTEIRRIMNGERAKDPNSSTIPHISYNISIDANPFGSSIPSSSFSTSGLMHIKTADDIASINYLTRVQLSQLLDAKDKWKALASSIGCSHMVQFIELCIDETSSPTMMLLDQYEQTEHASLSKFVNTLELMGEMVCANLVRNNGEETFA